jgi:hypothetical protein
VAESHLAAASPAEVPGTGNATQDRPEAACQTPWPWMLSRGQHFQPIGMGEKAFNEHSEMLEAEIDKAARELYMAKLFVFTEEDYLADDLQRHRILRRTSFEASRSPSAHSSTARSARSAGTGVAPMPSAREDHPSEVAPANPPSSALSTQMAAADTATSGAGDAESGARGSGEPLAKTALGKLAPRQRLLGPTPKKRARLHSPEKTAPWHSKDTPKEDWADDSWGSWRAGSAAGRDRQTGGSSSSTSAWGKFLDPLPPGLAEKNSKSAMVLVRHGGSPRMDGTRPFMGFIWELDPPLAGTSSAALLSDLATHMGLSAPELIRQVAWHIRHTRPSRARLLLALHMGVASSSLSPDGFMACTYAVDTPISSDLALMPVVVLDDDRQFRVCFEDFFDLAVNSLAASPSKWGIAANTGIDGLWPIVWNGTTEFGMSTNPETVTTGGKKKRGKGKTGHGTKGLQLLQKIGKKKLRKGGGEDSSTV